LGYTALGHFAARAPPRARKARAFPGFNFLESQAGSSRPTASVGLHTSYSSQSPTLLYGRGGGVGRGLTAGVLLGVGVGLGVDVVVGVGVAVAADVAVGVGLAGVEVGVSVAVAVGVVLGVAVRVGVAVAVGVGVGVEPTSSLSVKASCWYVPLTGTRPSTHEARCLVANAEA
jgi:hypothetical protein